MGLLSQVGKRSWRYRAVVGGLYVLLILGSITMVYPFMIMVSSSTANHYDYYDFSPLPRFLWDDTTLFWKYVALREGQLDPGRFATPDLTWDRIKSDPDHWLEMSFGEPFARDREPLARQAQDFRDFMQTLPIEFIELHSHDRYITRYPAFVRGLYLQRVGGQNEEAALALYNRENHEHHDTFYTVTFWGGQGYPYQAYVPDPTPAFQRVQQFKAHLGARWFSFTPTASRYQAMLRQRYGDVHQLNAAWRTDYAHFGQIPFPTQPPDARPAREDWRTFVVEELPLLQQRLPADLAQRLGLEQTLPGDPDQRTQWIHRVRTEVPAEQRELLIPEVQYVQFLQSRYGSIAAAGRAYGVPWTQPQDVSLPFASLLVHDYLQEKPSLRGAFLTANYERVLSYITTRGRALFNTVVLCALTVLSALTVNPLAAYAMSRYRLRATLKVLLFMLATMAFPAEVAMIPTFLLMRDLNMLNTFAALILPGMASGFSIFLLKGFFDSLPLELYEAADLDGASELRKFLTITLPLSKPILAVIALGSFTAAYTGWAWALVVCQDPKMWTIMVWLFAFQTSEGASAPFLTMTAFVVASLPPLLVFLFCQRIILRGIIIPTMK